MCGILSTELNFHDCENYNKFILKLSLNISLKHQSYSSVTSDASHSDYVERHSSDLS